MYPREVEIHSTLLPLSPIYWGRIMRGKGNLGQTRLDGEGKGRRETLNERAIIGGLHRRGPYQAFVTKVAVLFYILSLHIFYV
jgi:hypothetical protein